MSAVEVIRDVAKRRGLEAQHIVGPRRWSELVAARKEIAKALAADGWAVAAIARALGDRDHTTVLYYLGRVKQRQEGNA